jgi:hypothetical protein
MPNAMGRHGDQRDFPDRQRLYIGMQGAMQRVYQARITEWPGKIEA